MLRHVLFLGVLLAMLLTGCGGGGGGGGSSADTRAGGNTGSLSLSVRLPQEAQLLQMVSGPTRLQVRILDPQTLVDVVPRLRTTLDPSSGNSSLVVNGIPLGLKRVVVEALNSSDEVVARGEAHVDIGAGPNSVTLSLLPVGTPTALRFVSVPTSVASHSTFSVQVEVVDASGSRVTTSANPITLALASNPGSAILTGTLTVAAVNGLATFPDLVLNQVGSGYTLQASATGLSPAVSSPFDVTAARGTLTFLSSVATGPSPNMPAFDPLGKFFYVPAFGSNIIHAYSVNAATGALTPIAGQPFTTGSQPGQVYVRPDGATLYSTDAASNTISWFPINADGSLGSRSSIAGGSNPFGVTSDPAGRFLYVVNLFGNSVSAFTIDAGGNLSPLGTVATGVRPAQPKVSPDGRFLYVTNLSSDTLSVYSINPTTGALSALSPVATGDEPEQLVFSPDGNFLYVGNTLDDTLDTFAVDTTTGALTKIATTPANDHPGDVAMDPFGEFVFNINFVIGGVTGFTRDTATGALTVVPGSPFPAGAGTRAVLVHPNGNFAYVVNRSANSVFTYSIAR